jgi:hypothetical protein
VGGCVGNLYFAFKVLKIALLLFQVSRLSPRRTARTSTSDTLMKRRSNGEDILLQIKLKYMSLPTLLSIFCDKPVFILKNPPGGINTILRH